MLPPVGPCSFQLIYGHGQHLGRLSPIQRGDAQLPMGRVPFRVMLKPVGEGCGDQPWEVVSESCSEPPPHARSHIPCMCPAPQGAERVGDR